MMMDTPTTPSHTTQVQEVTPTVAVQSAKKKTSTKKTVAESISDVSTLLAAGVIDKVQAQALNNEICPKPVPVATVVADSPLPVRRKLEIPPPVAPVAPVATPVAAIDTPVAAIDAPVVGTSKSKQESKKRRSADTPTTPIKPPQKK